jgi:hypothetical protein
MNQRLEGLLCGLAGGAAGMIAMQLTQTVTSPLVRPRKPRPKDVFQTERSISLIGPQHREGEGATEAVARIGYRAVRRREPSPVLKRRLGYALHVGYGLLMAAGYGALRQRRAPRDDLAAGALFGFGLWALGDELAVPLFGLADKPTQYHPTYHLQMLAAHIGYGVATASATQAARALAARKGGDRGRNRR